jgi:putative redox protein
MITVELERIEGDYGFAATDANEHTVQFDSSIENGGQNFGVRPMQTLLMALGSCSGIDIVSILKKQRQPLNGFKMRIEGERERGDLPSLWKKVHVTFLLEGNLKDEKALKACSLSVEKYCSVAETLRRAGAVITWSLLVNSRIIK